MKYMLLIYHEEQAWDGLSEQERQNIYAEYRKFSEEIAASGNYLAGSELHPRTCVQKILLRRKQEVVGLLGRLRFTE